MAIRAGLIGYGLGGAAFHAPFIATTPGLTLEAIVTTNPERRAQAERAYPGARLLSSADELFTMPRPVDLVVVTTPNRSHIPLAMSALGAGLPVVIDKPIAPTSAAARAVIAEAARRGLMLTVFHNRRWDGDFLTVRRLLAEGALGDVHRFESRFERWRPAGRQNWRELADPEDAGGLLFDLGSHLIDQALVLFGPVESIYAEIDRWRPGTAVDDDVFLALTHRSGVRSHLWMSNGASQAGPRFRVLGNRAGYTKFGLDVQEAALRAGERPGPGWGIEPPDRWGQLGVDGDLRPAPTEPGVYSRFYEGVVAALERGDPPPVAPEDAVRVIEVIERARALTGHGASGTQ
jgi:predicted dehydrogenase